MGVMAVMGAGSWGTTFAQLAADAGQTVRLYARNPELADTISTTRINPTYLPGISLPDSITVTADPLAALAGADLVVFAIPSIGLDDQLAIWGTHIPPDATLVSLNKGADPQTKRFGSTVILDTLGVDASRMVVVSGPNLAHECALRLPAATVAAGSDLTRAEQVQASIMSPYFRVYTNQDVIGVEVAGAVKNVIAIAAGAAYGLGFGENTMAAVVTRGLAEMTRLGVALGGDVLTFAGLAGVGDLLATCTSERSRNRQVGTRLGRGEQIAAIVDSMQMVAEGVRASDALLQLAKQHGVDMPITAGVVAVCHHGADVRDVVKALLSRDAKPETYGLGGR